MSTLTIRQLDPKVKDRLRQVAALHGRSMEEEARVILRQAMARASVDGGLGSRIRARLGSLAVDLELPSRDEAPRAADVVEDVKGAA